MERRPDRERDLLRAVDRASLPPGTTVRAWRETDFPAIQRLSALEGWPTPIERPYASLHAWHHSWPALVLLADEEIIGFCRTVSDGAVTTYVAEILVAREWRGRRLGEALLAIAQATHEGSRLDLLASEHSRGFYEQEGFRAFPGYRRSWAEFDRED